MRRIPLPNDGWADLREPADLRVKHKHRLQAAIAAAAPAMQKMPDNLPDLPTDPAERAAALQKIDLSSLTAKGVITEAEMMALMRIEEVTVAVFLVAWSRKEPVPTPDTVGDMEEADYIAIAEATRADVATVLNGVDFSPSPDPNGANPTGRPGDSNGHSRAGDDSPSMTELQPASVSTSSAG